MKALTSLSLTVLLLGSLAFGQQGMGPGPGVKTYSASCGTFPCTSVLDDFNRANEGPPASANWTFPWQSGSSNGHKVVSNELTADVGDASSYWDVSTFGPNCEAYVTLTNSGGYAQLGARLNDVNTGSLSGYMVSMDGGNIEVYKWTSNSAALMGSAITQSFTNGDSIGLTVTGSNPTVVEVWYKVGAGAWTSLGTRSDSTSPHTGAGFIGIRSNPPRTFNDFGGGTR